MAKNLEAIPFTELVERVVQIARVDSDNDRSRARGAVQDVYVRKVPQEEDWSFWLASSAVTCDPEYKTGTVTVTTQATACTFDGGASLSAGMTGRKIKFNDNNDVYTLTFSNTTAATITPPLSGDVSISGGAFSIFQPTYALAADFDRFPKNGGLQLFQGGRPTILPEAGFQNFKAEYTPSPGTPARCRLVSFGTTGVPHAELNPPPLKAINLPYDYLRRPVALRETSAGTCTVSANGTTVTFHAGARLAESSTGWYLRINAFGTGADSEWYRVLGIASATSTATLQLAFGVSGATSAGYVLSAAPDMPEKLHIAVQHGAVTLVTADQNDELYQLYEAKYRETINEGKRTYKTRIYGQEVDMIFTDFNYRR